MGGPDIVTRFNPTGLCPDLQSRPLGWTQLRGTIEPSFGP